MIQIVFDQWYCTPYRLEMGVVFLWDWMRWFENRQKKIVIVALSNKCNQSLQVKFGPYPRKTVSKDAYDLALTWKYFLLKMIW